MADGPETLEVETLEFATRQGATLALHRHPANRGPGRGRSSLLYIHGATFPSRLSVAFRFDGRSWMDDLAAAGFDVWALDFRGYGESERYPSDVAAIPCRTAEATAQIADAVALIRERDAVDRVSLIAHSWGTLPAGHFAGLSRDLVERLVLFGPIAERPGPADPEPLPPLRQVTVQAQYDRFVADVPAGEAPVLELQSFPAWGEAYLDSDPASRRLSPPAVTIPSGPAADIRTAWSGALPYDPGRIVAPTLIVRGEWDSLCTDDDAFWLRSALRSCRGRRDVKVARATHLMHLETGRTALYAAVRKFLADANC